MSGPDTLLLGAVAYDPKVVTIWDGFRAWLRGEGLAFDYVLYSNYERQVDNLVAGRIDVAWNSPLAWVRARHLAAARNVMVTPVAMRDTDRDLTSVVVVRSGDAARALSDLKGTTVATGAIDSPQGTLLPLSLLRGAGLDPGEDLTIRRFDVGVGLHGDHVGGERAAARALMAGDARAACMLDGNLLLFSREGVLPSDAARVIGRTPPYDHCMMTAGPSAGEAVTERFRTLLLGMDYGDERLRPLLDLEGLKRWLPPRLDGYAQLERAAGEAGFYDAAGTVIAGDYQPRP
ncbi:MAG TPA: phosphate/phosphite/phosphonate ABC transporter substrate-binding protein [Trebonia sp.]|nr:phosphate/phosphite/phosphonate ABC transporter substrate-binding protein [Trebonia sp.]